MIPAHPPQPAAAYPVCPIYIPYRGEIEDRPVEIQGDRPDATELEGDRSSSEYRDRLHAWCIVQQLPNLQNVVVERFRRRNDAEAHLKVLRQMAPASYVIAFDTPQTGLG